MRYKRTKMTVDPFRDKQQQPGTIVNYFHCHTEALTHWHTDSRIFAGRYIFALFFGVFIMLSFKNQNLISIFRNLDNDVISGRGSDFFGPYKGYAVSNFFNSFRHKSNFQTELQNKHLGDGYPCGNFFSEPEVQNYDSPNLGHILLLNYTKFNAHILESYRTILLKLLKC